LLGRQFDESLTDGQMRVVPSLGTWVPWLLAPVPPGFLRVILGIIQVVGAIVHRSGFGTSSEEVGLELTFFAFKLYDLLLQGGDAVEGVAMARLPISGLLTEFEVLALQAIDFGMELAHLSAQVLHQSGRRRGGVVRADGTGALRNGRNRAIRTE
jgi:hypothetical protein